MTNPVKDLVRDQLRHAEKTLHAKRGEADALNTKLASLNGHCVDLSNQIDEYTNGVKQLTDERNSAIDQVNMLSGVKRDLDNQCAVLQNQIDAYREFMGSR
jgi:uncharacterized coiled-coil DUF342 family protein